MLDTARDCGPVRAAAVLTAWRKWHPEYASKECVRLLPELAVKWPGERAKRKMHNDRRAIERWCSDGEDVLNTIGTSLAYATVVRRKLGFSFERFDKVVAALKETGAVRVVGDGRLVVTASGKHAKAQLRARWLH